MKILYLGNFGNKFSDKTEEHIKFAFEQLGHEVITFEEKEFNTQRLLSIKADLFLFHKGGENFGVGLPRLIELLNKMTIQKVCWYFDKAWKGREIWLDRVTPFVDYMFVTDETWARRRNFNNVRILRQGIGNENLSKGKVVEKYKGDTAFVGASYGQRYSFVEALKEVYGGGFKTYNNVFGRDLYDLCASTKIFVAPLFPQDNFYWSSRVYMIIGSGGFLLHPKLEGIKTEFEDKKEIVYYRNGRELKEYIDYYLEHETERLSIQEAGYKKCIENFTYLDRVKNMLGAII